MLFMLIDIDKCIYVNVTQQKQHIKAKVWLEQYIWNPLSKVISVQFAAVSCGDWVPNWNHFFIHPSSRYNSDNYKMVTRILRSILKNKHQYHHELPLRHELNGSMNLLRHILKFTHIYTHSCTYTCMYVCMYVWISASVYNTCVNL